MRHFDRMEGLPHRSVLIVEDEQTARKALAFLFNDSGYDTDAVPTMEEALDHMNHGHAPTVVVLDVAPDLPGVAESVRRLQERMPHARFVILSASDQEELETICRVRDVECIQKPIIFSDLLRMLDKPTNMPN